MNESVRKIQSPSSSKEAIFLSFKALCISIPSLIPNSYTFLCLPLSTSTKSKRSSSALRIFRIIKKRSYRKKSERKGRAPLVLSPQLEPRSGSDPSGSERSVRPRKPRPPTTENRQYGGACLLHASTSDFTY